jgi:hypothetical protein
MFERRDEPVLPLRGFVARKARAIGVAAVIDAVALGAGAVGLRLSEGVDWTDAWLNAALVATGNGPLLRAQTMSGKLFLLCYALVGVVVFAAVISTLMVPILHRTLHVLQADVPED